LLKAGLVNHIDFALTSATTRLKMAIPNPLHWSGGASMACAQAIEAVVAQIQALQMRLNECLA
jgi:hypothetical protein